MEAPSRQAEGEISELGIQRFPGWRVHPSGHRLRLARQSARSGAHGNVSKASDSSSTIPRRVSAVWQARDPDRRSRFAGTRKMSGA